MYNESKDVNDIRRPEMELQSKANVKMEHDCTALT